MIRGAASTLSIGVSRADLGILLTTIKGYILLEV